MASRRGGPLGQIDVTESPAMLILVFWPEAVRKFCILEPRAALFSHMQHRQGRYSMLPALFGISAQIFRELLIVICLIEKSEYETLCDIRYCR